MGIESSWGELGSQREIRMGSGADGECGICGGVMARSEGIRATRFLELVLIRYVK